MRPVVRRPLLLAAALVTGLAVVAAGLLAGPWQAESRPQLSLALFGTLPILWQESDSLSDRLEPGAAGHWAEAVLRRSGRLTPLDALDPLPAGLDVLVMAQPRPLSPQENVALDAWVRAGGRVLLFADPMLTQHSRFALGDPRRPHAMVMLSPILAHWGLELQFDDSQAGGERIVRLLQHDVPVNLPGRLVRAETGGSCDVLAMGLAADCPIGRGRALVLADAAVLEPVGAAQISAREAVLDSLLDRLVLAR